MEIRTLQEDQQDEWLDHCASVFVQTTRLYFAQHWQNDPWKDRTGIFIAVDNSEGKCKIVSTVKVYLRELFFNGHPIRAGGIGEVSTSPQYQKRGLASLLLAEAEKFMKEQGILLGILHTGRAAPFYASHGWETIPMNTSTRPAAFYLRESDGTPSHHCREVDIHGSGEEENNSREALGRLYEAYCLHFNGAFRRNHSDYWKDWVNCELDKVSGKVVVAEGGSEGGWAGYLAYHWKEEDKEGQKTVTLVVLEFAVDGSAFKDDGGSRVFGSLLEYVSAKKGITRDGFQVVIRSAIADAFKNRGIEKEEEPQGEVQEDRGWMFKVIDPSILAGKERLAEAFGSNFIFWQVDKF